MDKFTLEIIQNSLIAIGEEMFDYMSRCSMSPIIYETLDFAVAITDAKGQLIAQGNGLTAFLACLDAVVKSSIEKFGFADLFEGDILIANTPYAGGGTHLSDVAVMMPVFYEGELIAFTVNKAHWTELGGAYPGSVSTVATEIFQEGLHFPFIKLDEKFVRNQALIDLIAANVRLPESTLGDLYAAVAACQVGGKRLKELYARYSKVAVEEAAHEFLNYAEKMTQVALRKLPRGIYLGKRFIENHANSGGDFAIHIKVQITEQQMQVDFSGSHPQILGSVNLSRTGLETACRSVFKAITTPHIPVNAGAFRALDVRCEPGTIVSAESPAAMSIYYECFLAALDLFWQVMAPLVPQYLPAGNYSSICATFISGIHPRTKKLFILAQPLAGGWGAGKNFDGDAGQLSPANGESANIPIELTELRYGIRVNQYRLHNEGGGYGHFRGGNGLYLDYCITADTAYLTAAFLGGKFAVWGMEGGAEGSFNYFEIIRLNGNIERHNMVTNILLLKGEVVRFVTATGGGYGNPAQRSPLHILADIKNEYITVEQAERVYPQVFS